MTETAATAKRFAAATSVYCIPTKNLSMEPFLLGSLIGAAGNVAGGAANAISTGFQNRASRQWSEAMYKRQFSDNIRFWQMQNEYNSPQQQMNRLQQAGLNPNLVYGGSPGGAAGTAAPINTPDIQAPQFRSVELGNTFSSLGAFFDYEIKQAQVDNLKMQNNVLLNEAALKAATTARSQFDLGFAQEMRDVSADAMREAVRQTRANTEFTLSQNERAAVMQESNLLEAAERVLKMRAETATTRVQAQQMHQAIRNMKADEQLRRLEIELRQMGINPNASMFWQVLGRVLNETIGNPVESGIQWFKDTFKLIPPDQRYKGHTFNNNK